MPPGTATNAIPVVARRMRSSEQGPVVKSEVTQFDSWSFRRSASSDGNRDLHRYSHNAQFTYIETDPPRPQDGESTYNLPWDEDGRLMNAQRRDYHELDDREPYNKRPRLIGHEDWLLTQDPPSWEAQRTAELSHQSVPSRPMLEYPNNAFKPFALKPAQATTSIPATTSTEQNSQKKKENGTASTKIVPKPPQPSSQANKKRKAGDVGKNSVAKTEGKAATKKPPVTLTAREKQELAKLMKRQSEQRRQLRKTLKVGPSKSHAWCTSISRELENDKDSDSSLDDPASNSETVKSSDEEVQGATLEEAKQKVEEIRSQISRRQAKMRMHQQGIHTAEASLEIWKRRSKELFEAFMSRDSTMSKESARPDQQLFIPTTATSPSVSADSETKWLMPPRLDDTKVDQIIAARREAIVISDEDMEPKLMPSTLSIGGTDMQPLVGKKARGLLRCPQDLIVLTNLGGDIQFFSEHSRELKLTASLTTTTDECKAEETVLISEKQNLLATTFEAKDASGSFVPKLSLLRYTSKRSEVTVTQQVFTNHVEKRSGINTIAAISDSQGEDIQFVTGGFTKKVLLWKLKPLEPSNHPEKMFDFVNHTIHDGHHTSAIRTFEYIRTQKHLYSGGMDKRLVVWDVAHQRAARSSLQFTGAVTNISARPNDPNCLLIQTQTPRMQFQLFDPRQSLQSSTVLPYTFPSFELPQQSGSLSAYVTGTFHPNGNLFVCGSMNPSSGRIYSWDLRYHATRSSEQSVFVDPQSLDLGHNTNVVSTIFDDRGSTMISCSSRNLAWTKIQPI